MAPRQIQKTIGSFRSYCLQAHHFAVSAYPVMTQHWQIKTSALFELLLIGHSKTDCRATSLILLLIHLFVQCVIHRCHRRFILIKPFVQAANVDFLKNHLTQWSSILSHAASPVMRSESYPFVRCQHFRHHP